MLGLAFGTHGIAQNVASSILKVSAPKTEPHGVMQQQLALCDGALEEVDDVSDREEQATDIAQLQTEGTGAQQGTGDYEKEMRDAKRLARAWILRPESVSELMVLRRQTRIMDVMQGALMYQNSVQWSVDQLKNLATKGHRDYRMVRLWKGTDATESQKLLGIQLREAAAWETFGIVAVRKDASFLRFRIFGRCSAVIADLQTTTSGQPFDFLGRMLTDDPQWAETFHNERTCMLESYTLSIRKDFPTVRALLDSKVLRAEAEEVADTPTATATVENLHAANLRSGRALSLHAHMPSLENVSAVMVSRRRRRLAQEVGIAFKVAVQGEQTSRKEKRGRPKKKVRDKLLRKKKCIRRNGQPHRLAWRRKRSGWQQFCKENSSRKLTARMVRELSRTWWTLTEDERQAYKSRADLSDANPGANLGDERASKRARTAHSVQLARLAAHTQHAGVESVDREPQGLDVGVDHALDEWLKQCSEAATFGKKLAHSSVLQRIGEEQALSVLKNFSEVRAARTEEHVRELFGAGAVASGQLSVAARPTTKDDIQELEMHFDGRMSSIAKLASAPWACGTSCNLASLEDAFAKRHRKVRSIDCKELGTVKGDASLCHTLGDHVCGPLQQTLLTRLRRGTVAFFPGKTPRRALITNGFIFCQIHFELGLVERTMYLWVAQVSWQPFKLRWIELEVCSEDHSENGDVIRVRMQYTGDGQGPKNLRYMQPFVDVSDETVITLRWLQWDQVGALDMNNSGRSDEADIRFMIASPVELWKGKETDEVQMYIEDAPIFEHAEEPPMVDDSVESIVETLASKSLAATEASDAISMITDAEPATPPDPRAKHDIGSDCSIGFGSQHESHAGGASNQSDASSVMSLPDSDDELALLPPVEVATPPTSDLTHLSHVATTRGPTVHHEPYLFPALGSTEMCALYETVGNSFYVKCPNPAHGRCILTRTFMGSARTSPAWRGQGRPLGFLLAWGECAFFPGMDSAADHMRITNYKSAEFSQWFSLDVRTETRYRHMLCPACHPFFRLERPKRQTESDEPAEIR